MEPTTGEEVEYQARTHRARARLVSFVAGNVSGLLGVGGGVINVPTMNVLMHVPIRVATTTSTYMLAATAAASATVYIVAGQVDPLLAAPVALGVIVGARARRAALDAPLAERAAAGLRGRGGHLRGGHVREVPVAMSTQQPAARRSAPRRYTSAALTGGVVVAAVVLRGGRAGRDRRRRAGAGEMTDLAAVFEGLLALTPWAWATLGTYAVVLTPVVGLLVTAWEYATRRRPAHGRAGAGRPGRPGRQRGRGHPALGGASCR